MVKGISVRIVSVIVVRKISGVVKLRFVVVWCIVLVLKISVGM